MCTVIRLQGSMPVSCLMNLYGCEPQGGVWVGVVCDVGGCGVSMCGVWCGCGVYGV